MIDVHAYSTSPACLSACLPACLPAQPACLLSQPACQSACPALSCPVLPCPALPCPVLPCPALPCLALPCQNKRAEQPCEKYKIASNFLFFPFPSASPGARVHAAGSLSRSSLPRKCIPYLYVPVCMCVGRYVCMLGAG